MKEFLLEFARDVRDMAVTHPWKTLAVAVLSFLIGHIVGAI